MDVLLILILIRKAIIYYIQQYYSINHSRCKDFGKIVSNQIYIQFLYKKIHVKFKIIRLVYISYYKYLRYE